MAVGVFCAGDIAFLCGQAEIVFATKDVVNANLSVALPDGGYASGLLVGVAVPVEGPATLVFADLGTIDISPKALVLAVSP